MAEEPRLGAKTGQESWGECWSLVADLGGRMEFRFFLVLLSCFLWEAFHDLWTRPGPPSQAPLGQHCHDPGPTSELDSGGSRPQLLPYNFMYLSSFNLSPLSLCIVAENSTSSWGCKDETKEFIGSGQHRGQLLNGQGM